MYFRTVSNCRTAPMAPKPVAAGAPPPDDVEMGGGDGIVENEGEGIVAEAVILQEDGQAVRELVDTPKPKKKGIKHAREWDEVTAKVLNILEKDAEDDDEVSLALASIGKGIKKTIQQPPQIQPPPQQQQPPQPGNFQPMPPPPLQRMDIAYDAMTNNTYQNL